MVRLINESSRGNKKDFQGLSTDTKPINSGDFGKIGGMSTFYESDTGEIAIYDAENINPDTSDGWWK